MSEYAPWYFMPYNGDYETFETNKTGKLKRLGFDYLIALHATGKDSIYGHMPNGETRREGLERGVNSGNGSKGTWGQKSVATCGKKDTVPYRT